MSERQDFTDIGERIQKAVQDAVDSMDFGQINSVVTDTVSGAIDEVRRQVSNVWDGGRRERRNDPVQRYPDPDGRSGNDTMRDDALLRNHDTPRYSAIPRRSSSGIYSRYRNTPANEAGSSGQAVGVPGSRERYGGVPAVRPGSLVAQRRQENGVRIQHTGKVGGVLLTVFGSIGAGLFALPAVGLLISWAFTQEGELLLPMCIFGILGAICGGLIGGGREILARLKRAERYAKLGLKKRYLELEELAMHTGYSLKEIRADVRCMLRKGIFPEGHMDKKEQCLILSDEIWKQYIAVQQEWENRQRLEVKEESKDSAKQEEIPAKAKAQEAGSQIEIEGRAYMDRLRQLNQAIPGEIISNKLYQLDYLLGRIFQVLREHPEKGPQMRRFMEYYLPTTVKLVEAYADFDKAGIQGENIVSAKREIEKTMDTINQAFEKLLDDMYQDAAMETAADAQVLKTLLAQDGYTKGDFEKKEVFPGGDFARDFQMEEPPVAVEAEEYCEK